MTNARTGTSYSRELRLLTPSQFSYVFSNAIPAGSKHLTVLARFNEYTLPRLGITVAKKRIKTAVQRNRIKRIVRENFRHQCKSLPNIDIIVVVKQGCDALSNAQLHELIQQSFSRISKKCAQSKKR